ncbi:MAG: hypothetical protein ACR2PL_04460, partial [Dehalococcoidia bacterium]
YKTAAGKVANELLYRHMENGTVIAHLVPAQPAAAATTITSFWEEWEQLTHEIGALWPPGLSAVLK